MRVVKGDLWEFHEAGAWACIPVNIGYKKDGENVMGRGVAVQAAKRWPDVPKIWGGACKTLGSKVSAMPLFDGRRLIFFPTKPLNVREPWASWRNMASPRLIERSATTLASLVEAPCPGCSEDLGPVRCVGRKTDCRSIEGDVVLPLVGCGNGKLKEKDVLPILERVLVSDRFVLVRK